MVVAADTTEVNLSDTSFRFLTAVKSESDQLFHHAIAILHAPRYGTENSGALSTDWPRVPLPSTANTLAASAALGRQVAALLDCEQPVPRVTVSPVRPELRAIGIVSTAFGKLDPDSGDLDITAGWGHPGKGGITMPAKGKLIQREFTPDERAVLAEGARALSMSAARLTALLGATTYDVFLNDKVYWKNIPAAVWEYTLGGYQVIKKWLSYREKKLLGRSISKDEARYVAEIARRIAALLLMGPALDANYEAVKRHPYPWSVRSTVA